MRVLAGATNEVRTFQDDIRQMELPAMHDDIIIASAVLPAET